MILRINFETKDMEFIVESEGKKNLLKSIRPQKWYGKINPAVGFYGKNGTISVEWFKFFISALSEKNVKCWHCKSKLKPIAYFPKIKSTI